MSKTLNLTYMKTTLLVLAVTTLLSGCYSTAKRPFNEERHPDGVPSSALNFVSAPKTPPPPMPLAQRQDAAIMAVEDAFSPSRRYSFKAQGAPLRLALAQFAQAFKLNIVADQDVSGVVTVDVTNLALDQSLDIILGPLGLGWWRDGTVVHVSRQVTRNYTVDYPRITRTGSSSSSGSAGGSTGSVSTSDSMNFWSELESEIKAIMKVKLGGKDAPTEKIVHTDQVTKVMTSAEKLLEVLDGNLVINKSTGMVQVTTSPAALRQIDLYMKHLISRMNKQVYIEVKIMEVTLRDDNAFGIDWSKVTNPRASNSVNATSTNTVASSGGSLSGLVPTIALTLNPFSGDAILRDVVAAVSALEAQGDVKVISQPRIRTLNNQPAIIKTGTERTFFTSKVTVTKGANGAADTRDISDEAKSTIDGILLTVVPQVGADDVIAMDVTPSLTKVIGFTQALSGLSSAPITETNQMTTLVRVHDGETAVIGGMIIEEASESSRQMPGIGDVPGIGWLFKGKYNNRLRKELVIFITPHVISN
ncbi:MAG: hypothetical protein HHJ12_05715 [Glaciimonas sp.]|nr:hypothetical protein [Glaciimonas sp.]